MIRLFSIEFQKLWQNRTAKRLYLAYFILILSIPILSMVQFDAGEVKLKLTDQGIFSFPLIWHFNTYLAASFKFFLAIVIVSIVTNEYTYGTLKQNLIDGLSKKQFIASKFVIIAFISLTATIFVFIFSLILGYIFSDNTSISLIVEEIDYLLAYFVKLLGFFSFCLFLGILIKRSAFALGTLIFWYFIESIFSIIIISFPAKTIILEKIFGFFPLESMSRLILNPMRRMYLIKMIEQESSITNKNDYSVSYSQMFIVLCWVMIFIYFSYRMIKKRDL